MTSIADLRNGCAVITGAGSGIGAAIALQTAEQYGVPIAVLDIELQRAEHSAAAIRATGGTAAAYALDVTDLAAVDRVAQEITQTLGAVTLLVANAGIEHSGSMWTIPPEHWRRVQDVNVNGMFNTVRAYLPGMIDSGQRAHVVCVASIGALGARSSMSAYIVSKHAALALGQCLSEDLNAVNANIGVSVLLPGPVATRIAQDALVTPSDEAAARMKELASLLDAEGHSPREVAIQALAGVVDNRGLIHTHQEAAERAVGALIGELESSLSGGTGK